ERGELPRKPRDRGPNLALELGRSLRDQDVRERVGDASRLCGSGGLPGNGQDAALLLGRRAHVREELASAHVEAQAFRDAVDDLRARDDPRRGHDAPAQVALTEERDTYEG